MPWTYVCHLENLQGTYCYTGYTSDIRRRLAEHNAGLNASTAAQRPYRCVFAAAFPDRRVAQAFERYMKSGSGRAFGSKRLWPKLKASRPTNIRSCT